MLSGSPIQNSGATGGQGRPWPGAFARFSGTAYSTVLSRWPQETVLGDAACTGCMVDDSVIYLFLSITGIHTHPTNIDMTPPLRSEKCSFLWMCTYPPFFGCLVREWPRMFCCGRGTIWVYRREHPSLTHHFNHIFPSIAKQAESTQICSRQNWKRFCASRRACVLKKSVLAKWPGRCHFATVWVHRGEHLSLTHHFKHTLSSISQQAESTQTKPNSLPAKTDFFFLRNRAAGQHSTLTQLIQLTHSTTGQHSICHQWN